MLPERN